MRVVLFFRYSWGGVAPASSAVTNRYVALILDTSGSMYGEPFRVQKEAAKSFCEKLFNSQDNNKVALVRLDSTASILCDFTDNLTSLDYYIDRLTEYGGTNTNDALVKAGEILDEIDDQSAIKNIVLCSDGLPEAGQTSYSGRYTYEDQSYSYPYANVAYETAETLKKKYKIFTLGFFHGLYGNDLEFGKKFMKDIASDNSDYVITKVEDLVITFGEVAEDVIGEDKNPIIVIPGIMGSRFFTSDTVFNDTTKVWDPVISVNGIKQLNSQLNMSNTLYIRPCENQNIDVNDSKNSENSVVKYGREYGAQNTYQKLVDRLCDVYSADKGNYRPIYFFSYDWRKSNTEAAVSLDKCIENILEETGAEKVNLVCHSMGGLVASKYYVEYGSKGQVEDIITCGTPYEGAPKLINSVMNFDVLGEGANLFDLNTWEDTWEDWILGLFGGMNKELKASFMGVTELLPTENYISAIPMLKVIWKPFTWGDYELPFTTYQAICRKVFGESRYNSAYTFQESLKDSGYNKLLEYDKSYYVLGINQKTITAIKYQFVDDGVNQRLYEEDLAYNTKGDGTVPYFSSSISEQLEDFDSNRVFKYATDHGGVVKEDDCLEFILAKLNHTIENVSSDVLRSTPYIVIRIACPVDVTINYGGETISSVSGDFYPSASFGRIDMLGESDDIKLLCLDNASDILVMMNGTDEGTMNYAIRFFDESGDIYKEDSFEDIPVTKDTVIRTGTDEAQPTVLQIDKDGDGTFDDYIVPSSSEGAFNITSHPEDLTIQAGESATFKVTTDAIDPKYQWYVKYDDGKGWSSIEGATNSEYSIPEVALSDDGNQYHCLVANDKKHTLSSKVAVLHVSNAANTTDPSTPTVSPDNPGGGGSGGGCDAFRVAGLGFALLTVLTGKFYVKR